MGAFKTRRRPRVRSASFRAFWWLVRREAVAAILWPEFQVLRPGLSARWIVVTRWETLARHARRALYNQPSRRYRA